MSPLRCFYVPPSSNLPGRQNWCELHGTCIQSSGGARWARHFRKVRREILLPVRLQRPAVRRGQCRAAGLVSEREIGHRQRHRYRERYRRAPVCRRQAFARYRSRPRRPRAVRQRCRQCQPAGAQWRRECGAALIALSKSPEGVSAICRWPPCGSGSGGGPAIGMLSPTFPCKARIPSTPFSAGTGAGIALWIVPIHHICHLTACPVSLASRLCT